MTMGTRNFTNYATVLRRVMMSEFVDQHVRATREAKYRASLMSGQQDGDQTSLASHFEYHRNRKPTGIDTGE